MDPVKIAGVDTWPVPKNVTEVCKILGFLNFYHPFIPKVAHIARPLHQLTRKDQEWQWGKEEQEVFNKLKSLVMAKPVLAHAKLDCYVATERQPERRLRNGARYNLIRV